MSTSFGKLSLSCVSLIAIVALSACGGGSGGGSSTTPSSSDFTAPDVSFTPDSLTVEGGETGTSTLSSSDNIRVVSGPTVSCTNGGSFANGVFTAPTVTETVTSVCTATASDAAGNTGRDTLTVTIPSPQPDTTDPVVTFSPNTLTVVGGGTASSTLTATDDTVVESGPTVVCTNNGSFSNNTFTAPIVTTQTTSVCTATAADPAGNMGEAILTVVMSPQTSEFFATIVDTIIVDPVLGFVEIPTDPSTLIGVSKNASGAVSTFAVTNTGIGTYDEVVLTAQPTLGTVGTPPLDLLYGDIDGVDGGVSDLIFLDEFNDLIIGASFNADNTFGAPVTQSISNGCDAGSGGGTRFVGTGDDSTRDDILVGTTDGLFYVGAGFANDGVNTSGLSAPVPIVSSGNFCSLIVGPTGQGDTTYISYDPDTALITGVEGSSNDASSYEEDFTADLSGQISTGLTPVLFDAFFGTFSAEQVITVFNDPQQVGSTVIISDVGVIPDTTVINIDMENPTDILLISRGTSDDVLLVSPDSQFAVYIRDINNRSVSVELIDIGLGFDQVEFAGGGVAFASSTQGNIVVRSL